MRFRGDTQALPFESALSMRLDEHASFNLVSFPGYRLSEHSSFSYLNSVSGLLVW